jgi:putative ABC transport system permease protein
MFQYYFGLALRSLKRNIVLTVLMVVTIGVGIGTSMTTLTVFRAMDADPIPQKSAQLYAPQIDNWGPAEHSADSMAGLEDQLSYIDAMALMRAHRAQRQVAAYQTGFALTPENPELKPFKADARATFNEFFAMFDVPFRYGHGWGAAEDEAHAPVVVISDELNQRLFGGANSVGRSINLDDQDYRIIGVMAPWEPVPRFYDLITENFAKTAQVFLPFNRAIERQMSSWGFVDCADRSDPSWQRLLASSCVWIQFWVELPTAKAAEDYRLWLDSYAREQQRSGRFAWPAYTRLRDLKSWLTLEHVVSDETRLLVLVSFSFLLVCVLNATGLMLAKFMSRSSDIGVRRALGANRRAILAQCLIEAGVVGLAGGLLGIALTVVGLTALRGVLSEKLLQLTTLNLVDVGIAFALAIIATIGAALYPTWRASRVQPAWQLKAQ